MTSYSACATSALFHAESVHGVETLRGFPLPVAATAFTALCPSSSFPLAQSLRQEIAPKNNVSTPPRETLHLRSEEQRVVASQSSGTSSGIHASGRSVLSEAVLSDIHWPCLSQPFSPFEDLSPRVSALPDAGPPLMGFSQRWTNPSLRPLSKVSKNSRVDTPLSRSATLLGVCVLVLKTGR